MNQIGPQSPQQPNQVEQPSRIQGFPPADDMDGNPIDRAVLIVEEPVAIVEQDEMRIKEPLVNRAGQFEELPFGAAVVERRKDPGDPNGRCGFRQGKSSPMDLMLKRPERPETRPAKANT